MKISEKIIKLLKEQKKTISIAESCTGGLVSNLITNVPGASSCLMSSIIAYSNEAKIKFLKVPGKTIKRFGAVSEQTAMAMAQGARKGQNTDYGIAITGIAGPTGGTKIKPVGLVFIALSAKNEILCIKCMFKGTRLNVKAKAARQAMQLLLEFL